MKAYGSKTAPITMEVFSDYQCPACRAFYQDSLRLVIENYVNSGKVYLVHRDFPLPVHAYSRQAARYANAAARIGRFDKAEEALFAKQDSWDKALHRIFSEGLSGHAGHFHFFLCRAD